MEGATFADTLSVLIVLGFFLWMMTGKERMW